MEHLKSIAAIFVMFLSLALPSAAQQGSSQIDAAQEAQTANQGSNANDAQRQNETDGQQNNNAAAATNGQAGTATAGADTTAAAGADTTATAGQAASNTPAVEQTTSSQSGSPAVLSGEKGTDRDGTNNVQRASMNMAGSPAGNLNLDGNNTVDVSTELRDRQNRTQDKSTSAQNVSEETGDAPSHGESGEINDKTRRENNARSDQNLSAKEKNNTGAEEEEKEQSNRDKNKKGKKKGRSEG